MEVDEFVDIKCNKCGEVYSFCPMQVKFAPQCKCSNSDSGNPKYWKDYQFGNFTPLKSYKLRLPLLSIFYHHRQSYREATNDRDK